MESPLWILLISFRSVSKHGYHMEFLFLIGRFLKIFLLWNCLTICTETWVRSIYMYGKFCIKFPQSRMKGERHSQMNWNLVWSIYGRSSLKIAHLVWSINKHGRHRQFLFLIGRFLKIFSAETTLPNKQKLDSKHCPETIRKHSRHKYV